MKFSRMCDELNHTLIYIWSSSFSVLILNILIASFTIAAIVKGDAIIEHNENSVPSISKREGANVTLICKANESVYWIDISDKFPLLWTVTFAWDYYVSRLYMSAAKFHEGKFKIHYENSTDNIHYAKLELFNVDHRSIGRYYCVKNSTSISEVTDLDNQKYVYLYVEDDERHVSEIHHHIIFVWDNCRKYYPCKPISTGKEVTLRINNKSVIPNGNVDLDLGFLVSNSELDSNNRFECSSKDDKEIYEVRVQTDLPSPICHDHIMITSKMDNFLIDGVDLEFNCSYKYFPAPENFTWHLPNNTTAKTEITRIDKYNERLIVKNVNRTMDLGKYKCVVDVNGVVNSATIDVTNALYANESFFNVTAHPQFNHVESSKNKSSEMFLVVKYLAYPEPVLQWFDKENKSIQWTLKEDINRKFEAFYDLNKKWTALKIRNATLSDSGNYTLSNGLTENKTFELLILGKPQIEIETIGENVIKCHVYGYPASNIDWIVRDNNGTIIPTDRFSINISNTTALNQTSILNLNPNNGMATVQCNAKNKEGYVPSVSIIPSVRSIKTGDTSNTIIIIALVSSLSFGFFIVFLCAYLSRRKRRNRRQIFSSEMELRPDIFDEFLKGDPDGINTDMTLDDQVGLLPYNNDSNYEFPREKLQIGKQIGCGAFGMVCKAIAHGILTDEKETTVAVKTAKQAMDSQEMRALMSELKILVHLGKHLNVVNLLGAVTKNVSQTGEFMVIVEFCEFGNLEYFLKCNRQHFIDEIVRTNEAYIIVPRKISQTQSNCSGYSSMYSANSSFGDHQQQSSYTRDPVVSNYSSAESAIVQNSQNKPTESNNYVSMTEGATQSNVRKFTTTDLIRWSLQIAQGMTYLSSRNVLHGDLAARNILLCSNNIVKICDFGLARSVYKRENYHKKSETLLPLKWMAIESIKDNVFSTYSDVWSFGIVMWELFSLGKVPYPGIDQNQELYKMLLNNYRMDKPDYATPEIYNIILSCWEAHPRMRPLFDMLEKEISNLLENEDIENFARLNEPYVERNRCDFASREIDWLTQVASPCCVPMPEPSQNEQRNIFEVPQTIQPNQQSVSQLINSTPTAADHSPQSPSIMTNYLSFNEILKVQNKSTVNSSEEIEMCERKSMPNGEYMRMSSITLPVWNNSTNEQKPLISDNNYLNTQKIYA